MKEFNYQDYLTYQILKRREEIKCLKLSDVSESYSRKWDVEKYIQECQEMLESADRIKLGEYYVVDVNNYTNEELEEDNLFLSKMLLLEKLDTEQEIFSTLNRVIEIENDENNRVILKRVIAFILKEKLSFEKVGVLLKKLESEEKDMVLEVIRKENERLIKKGERKGEKKGRLEILKQSIKNMLKRNMPLEEIQEILEIPKEEIEKIQKMLTKI